MVLRGPEGGKMEVIAEIEPTRAYEKLIRFINAVKDFANWVDVPEAPLGKSRALSLAVSIVVQKDFGVPTITHVRVQDHNRIGLRNIFGGTRIGDIKRVVLLRGDPVETERCNLRSPEEVIKDLREENPSAEAGLLLSVRKDPKKIIKRLRSGADFYLILNSKGPKDLMPYVSEAEKSGSKLIPYILVETPKNSELLASSLPNAPRFKISDLKEVIEKYSTLVDSVLISVPGDLESMREALRIAKRV